MLEIVQNKLSAVVPGLGRVCIVVLLLILAGCGKWVEEEVDLGYQGEARYNALLAGQQLCESMDLDAISLPGLNRISTDVYDRTIVMPAEAFVEGHLSPDEAIEFVRQGNHLVVYYSNVLRKMEVDGVSINLSSFSADTSLYGLDVFMERCGVEMKIKEDGYRQAYVFDMGRDIGQFRMSLSDEIMFKCNQKYRIRPPLLKKSNQAYQPIVSISLREGTVTFVGDGQWMTQPEIGDAQHASMLYHIVAPDDYWTDEVHFIYGMERGFMALLWKHGWTAIVPLCLWLILWLWQGLKRYEQISEPADDGFRDFAEHIRSTGRYWWRHQCQTELIERQREHVFSLIRKRWPHAAHLLVDQTADRTQRSRLARDSMMHSLMQMTKLSANELQSILMARVGKDPDQFVQIINRLKHIEESI